MCVEVYYVDFLVWYKHIFRTESLYKYIDHGVFFAQFLCVYHVDYKFLSSA